MRRSAFRPVCFSAGDLCRRYAPLSPISPGFQLPGMNPAVDGETANPEKCGGFRGGVSLLRHRSAFPLHPFLFPVLFVLCPFAGYVGFHEVFDIVVYALPFGGGYAAGVLKYAGLHQ